MKKRKLRELLDVLRRILRRLFRGRETAYVITSLPIGLELSDGDKARLYGWPDRTVEDAERDAILEELFG